RRRADPPPGDLHRQRDQHAAVHRAGKPLTVALPYGETPWVRITAAGTDVVLADRASSALYVRVNDQLHPVLNLASARLIAGKPVSP
ncbi:type VII secretion protein EccB, partial [Mycolicibacterium insubricum]|nr:type VII secretion protein EccB [Mycolicibacterium insubricum]